MNASQCYYIIVIAKISKYYARFEDAFSGRARLKFYLLRLLDSSALPVERTAQGILLFIL